MRRQARGLIGNQQFHHHGPRLYRALRLAVDFHADGGCAFAGRGQHALTFNLHHASAAVAVGAISGFRPVAQMRDLGAHTARHIPNGLARPRLDLGAVEFERQLGHGAAHPATSFGASVSGK
jgi:hypothetical protein